VPLTIIDDGRGKEGRLDEIHAVKWRFALLAFGGCSPQNLTAAKGEPDMPVHRMLAVFPHDKNASAALGNYGCCWLANLFVLGAHCLAALGALTSQIENVDGTARPLRGYDERRSLDEMIADILI